MPQVTGQVRGRARDSRPLWVHGYSWVSEPDMYRLLQRGSYAGRNPPAPQSHGRQRCRGHKLAGPEERPHFSLALQEQGPPGTNTPGTPELCCKVENSLCCRRGNFVSGLARQGWGTEVRGPAWARTREPASSWLGSRTPQRSPHPRALSSDGSKHPPPPQLSLAASSRCLCALEEAFSSFSGCGQDISEKGTWEIRSGYCSALLKALGLAKFEPRSGEGKSP